MIIIDEVSMMGRNMLVHIERRLRQVSGREDLPHGVFIVIFVGDSQQLPPVVYKSMYTEGNEEASLLFNNTQNVLISKQPQKYVRNSPEELNLQRILQHCQ